MALAHGSVQWRLVDYLGVETSKIIYFQADDTKTIANIVSDLNALGALIDPITDAASAGIASFSINFSPTGLKTTPNEGNPLTTGILSTFSQTGVPNAFSDLVPAAAQAQIANGHIIDTGGSPYAAYVTALTVAGANSRPESNIRLTLTGLRRNDINTRKHRKQQSVKTSEV